MLVAGYRLRLIRPDCNHSAETVNAIAELADDVAAVFPYLNSVVRPGRYSPRAPAFGFRLGDHRIVLRPREAAVSTVEDEADARRVLDRLVELVNQTWERRGEIAPSHEATREPALLEVYRLLPGGNCRLCGQPTCLAFAAKLLREGAVLSDCRPLFTEEHDAKRQGLLALLRAAGLAEP